MSHGPLEADSVTSLCANSAKHRPAAGVGSACGLESSRPVAEEPGSPASDPVLPDQSPSPGASHVLSGAGSSYLTQQKQWSWVFGSEA